MEETEILTQPPAVWVRIDLNARSRDGYVRARLSRASGPVVTGDEHVIVYEPEDGVAAPARVIRVDHERGFAHLDVRWQEMDDATAYGWMTSPSLTYVQDSESNAAADVSMRLGFVERLRASGFLSGSASRGFSSVTPFPVQALAAQ